MGLFSGRKHVPNEIKTSANGSEYANQPSKEEIELDVRNEQAEVLDREVAPKPEPVSSNDETVAEPREEAPSYVAFSDKPPVRHTIGQTHVFAIINQKGGVGKSTTAINLASCLGAQGKEVLLVDLDPQGNATSGYGINKGEIEECVYDVLLNEVDPEEVILACVDKGVDVLPSTINLAGAEVELVNVMAREGRLKESLDRLRGIYDYILVDCPPSLGLLTVNALVAADKLLVPIQCEFYALEGVTKLLDSMNRVKNALNPRLDIFGIVLTMFDSRTKLSNQVADEVRKYFGDKVFETVIPRTVKLSEAPSYGQPISAYAPDNAGAIAYKNLAEEVVKRG